MTLEKALEKAKQSCDQISHQGQGLKWNSKICRSGSEVLEAAGRELAALRKMFPWKWWSKEEIGQRAMPDLGSGERASRISARLKATARELDQLADELVQHADS